MQIIGTLTTAHLAEMRERGLDPKTAVDATLAAAKDRYPKATVIIQRAVAHDGFDVVAF